METSESSRRRSVDISADPTMDSAFDVSLVTEHSPIVLKQLSKPDHELREALLLKMRNEPASIPLQAYFEKLKKGSDIWDVETYIGGLKHLAKIVGAERGTYYDSPLKGLSHPDSFAEEWNKTNPQLAISAFDRDIRLQCPASWSNMLKGSRQVLTYESTAPLSQGFNELFQGPTTMDCGIATQVYKWMGIRNLFGDEIFDTYFQFEKGHFVLTQNWADPLNKFKTDGSLLFPLFDHPLLHQKACGSDLESRVRVKSVFNHERYLAKHPGGVSRLENVIQIDEDYIIFSSEPTKNILSRSELEEKLKMAFNAPRGFADVERLWMYQLAPSYIHPDFAPKTWGTLSKEAQEYADYVLDEEEWLNSASTREREADGLDLVFNIQRLIGCVEKAREEYQGKDTDQNILYRVREHQAIFISKNLESYTQQLRI